MYVSHYNYIDGDELSFRQYWRVHYNHLRLGKYWHIKYAKRSSWLKKSVFRNLLRPVGIILLAAFLFLLYLVIPLSQDYPFIVLFPIIACGAWVFDIARSYYYSFIKPKDITATLQKIVDDNQLEVISKPSLDFYLVRKDGHLLEVSYAYEYIMIRDLFYRKNLIVIKACYKTTDRALINQHGLVTLPFESKFNEYSASVAQDVDIRLDERQICAIYPVDAPRQEINKGVSTVTDLLDHFGLTAVSAWSANSSHNVTNRSASALSVIFYLFAYFACLVGRMIVAADQNSSADYGSRPEPFQKVAEYYVNQNKSLLSSYEPHSLLFYATITYDPSNERGVICMTFDNEILPDIEPVTLGYYRQSNMVIKVCASRDISPALIAPLIGDNLVTELPPVSYQICQSDSTSACRTDYFLNENGRITDRKIYNYNK